MATAMPPAAPAATIAQPMMGQPVMAAQPYPGQPQPQVVVQGQQPMMMAQAQYAGQPQVVVQGQPQTTVVVHQQATTDLRHCRRPVVCRCPSCGHTAATNVAHFNGAGAWLACLGLCLVGCNLGCCFIPFCVEDCKDVVHSCSNCQG